MAAATDELMLLERVFLRIGAAESDDQLQNALSKFLPPVLLKLSSPQDGVRKKVMELLVHVNKRVKSRPQVQLPVESLLVQYQDPSASSFVTNFTVIYIRLGFPRLSLEKQAELVPSVLSALNNKPVSHQDSLFLVILPALGHVKVPTDPAKCSVMFGLSEKLQLAKQFADFMLDVLLAPYGWTSVSASTPTTPPNSASSIPGEAGTTEEVPTSTVPPGMSEYAYRRVCGETPMKAEELEQTKVGIIKFLSAGVLPEPDILCHFVVASADSRFSVVTAAETELRKIMKSLDWTNAAMMAPLFSLYLGSQQLHSTSGKGSVVKPELRRAPAGTRLRLKLLPCLTKAREAALPFPLCIQVFFDSLYSKNTNFRLKTLALQFCLTIIQHVNPALLSHVAGVLLTGLLKLFTDGDPGLKGQVYSVIGQLAVRFPSLVNQDLNLLTTFLTALGQEESKDLRLFIREALLHMVEAFRPEVIAKSADHPARIGPKPPLAPHLLRAQMLDLLTAQFESDDPMLQYVVIRFIEGTFASTHAPSRYLLLMASADTNKEVSSAALKALGLEEKTNVEEQPPPQFPEMVQHLWDKKQKSTENKKSQANQSAFSPVVFVQVIKYLRVCLAHSAGVVSLRESLDLPNENTPKIGRYLRQLHGSKPNILDSYLTLVHQLLVANPGPEPLAAVVEVVGSVPDLLAKNFLEKLTVFKNLLSNTNKKTREIAAEVYGILLAHCVDKSEFEGKVKALASSAGNSKAHLEEQLGSCLSSAYAIERYIRKERANGTENRQELVAWPTYQATLTTIATCVSSSVPALMETACESFGLLARCGPLALPVGPSEKDELTLKSILAKLKEILKDTKASGAKETVGKAAGYIFVGDQMPFVREALEGFVQIGKETREVDFHMELGDVIVNCILGPASPAARDFWTTEEKHFKPPAFETHPADSVDAQWFYDLLINDLAFQQSPAVRQMTCFWLVSLLKNCRDSVELKKRLSAIQKALLKFLGEPSEILQDVTATGLALVREQASPEDKKQILEDLMNTFQTGQRSARQVTSDTKVFEEGALGAMPGGGQISTYGDICKLASHLNKPDLVYTFMNLSKHNTVWSSKKGAAFSISVLATTMRSEEMTPLLPKIVPVLYRYRFDPNPRTQTAMSSIWHRLVPESQRTVDQYHREIMQELVDKLVANEYRVRHSCCAAIEDFVRGGPQRTIMDSVEFIPELWANLFRVMDDPHERTRQAACKTAQTLRAACARACDSEKGKDGQAMVQAVLPIMLEKGITHTVAEVRAVSLQTVSQLVNVAGAQLKPHLSVLLPALLEAKGDLERSLGAHLTRSGADANDVDSAMVSYAKTSFTMDPITKCVQYVDAEALETLIPRIADMIKHTVNLGTAVAVTKLLTMLSFPLRKELQPHAGKLLGALMHRLSDRNSALRNCYATAIADIVGSAKESSLEKLFTKLREWYCVKEEEHIQSAVCQTLRAISRQNNDVIKNYSDILLPVIFLAMHQKKTTENKSSIEVWDEIWSDSTSSYEGAFRLHGAAIIGLLSDMLQSSSWAMKAQAADAVSTLANKVGESLDKSQRENLISILLNGLSGRTWEGKQCLLQALGTICSKCRESLRRPDNAEMVESIINALLRESKKEQVEYKTHALSTLGDVLNDLQVDRFKDVYSIISETLNKAAEKGRDSDADAEENSQQRNQWLRLQEVAYEVLGKAWPYQTDTQKEYQLEVVERLEKCLISSTRGVQGAVIRALKSYVDKLCILQPEKATPETLPSLKQICAVIERTLQYSLGITKNSQIRKESLTIVLQLGKRLQECGYTEVLQSLTSTLSPQMDDLLSDTTPEVRTRVVDIREFFKEIQT